MGAAVVAGGAIATKALYDIGAAATDMDNEIRIGTGATGKALEDMQGSARDIAKKVPADLGQVGTAVADLNTNLGLTGPVLDTVASQVLEAGRMLGEDVNIKNASSALNGFKVEAEDTPDALDDIFRVSQATGTSMNELTGQLSTQAGVLSELGLGLGDSAALIGGLSKAGIDSNAVVKGLGRSMQDLAKDGEPTSETFGRVMGDLEGFIAKGETASAMDLAGDLFGTRAAPQFIAALESGALSMEDLMGATGATQDTILGLADETRTAGDQWGILKNNAMLALEPIGSVIFGVVGDALGALAAWISTVDFSPIQEFADQIGPALGEFAGQAGDVLLPILSELGPMLTQAAQGGAPLQAMFAAIVPHLQTIGTAVLGLLPSLVSFGSAVLPVIMGAVSSLIPLIVQIASTAIPAVLGVVQALLPIAQNIVTTLIPMIVTGIQTLIPQILGIIDPLMSIVHTVIDILGPAINFLLPIVQLVFSNVVTIIGGAIGVVTGILTAVAALLRGDFAGAWQAIKGIVGTVINTVKEYVNNGLNFVREHFGTVIETVKTTVSDGFQTMADTVSTKIGDVVGFVKEVPGKVLDALGNLGDLLLGSGKALMDGFTQGIKNGVQGALDAASGAVQSVRDFFPFSPAKRGPFSGSGYTDRSGKALVGDFAKAMTSEISTVTRAANKVATAGTFEAGFDLNRRPGASGRASRGAPAGERHVHIHIDGAFIGDRLSLARELRSILDRYDVTVGEPA